MKTRRRAGNVFIALLLALGSSTAIAQAPSVDMAEVRRLARQPVETIFAGAPIDRVSDADYWQKVRGSSKPVVVIFYANQDERSRHLATLIRYIALEYGGRIEFYGYPVTAGVSVGPNKLAALKKKYKVKQVPATLFYDNDHGQMELERAEYSVPAVITYQTPRPLLWGTYHQRVRKYIQDNILH